MAIPVKAIMTTPVVTVDEETGIEEAARLLARHRISGVPVVDAQGALVGVLSEFDVISWRGHRVGDVMSPEVISVGEETSVEEVARLLTDQRIRRVPILSHGRLVGIVTRADLVEFFARSEWCCQNCGYAEHGFQPPTHCPTCGADDRRFTLQQTPPGM